jgi:hypothetical protein
MAFGVTSTNDFTFTSASSGTFTVSSIGGTQTGVFALVASPTGAAPPSVLNDRVQFQIAAGHGNFATHGNYTIKTAPAGNTYTLSGSPGIAGSSGAYTYRTTTPTTALLSVHDSRLGPLMEELSFNTATSGSFLVGNSATDSWQIGTFTLASSRRPTGNVELATATTLAGWAWDADTPAAAIRVNLLIDGVTTLTTLAQTQRADLATALGSGNHAFSFTLPALAAGFHRADVYAIDNAGTVVLLASRTLNTNLLVTGHLDVTTAFTLAGWVVDPNSPSSSASIAYSLDGDAPQTAPAALNRPDLATLFTCTTHGFNIALPKLPTGRHTLAVWAIDRDNKAFVPLGIRTIVSQPAPGTHLPLGSLDIANPSRIAGWVYDADAGPHPIQARIDIDSDPGTPFLANSNRSDLVRLYGTGQLGFDLTSLNLSPGPHRIDLFALDNSSSAPVLIASKIIADPAPFGIVQTLTATAIAGWAYARAADNHQAQLRIDIDHVPGALITATLPSPALEPALGGRNFGFSAPLHVAPGLHLVQIYLLDPVTDSLLFLRQGSLFVA